MNKNHEKMMEELKSLITLQFDYPPNGEGSIGFRGHNMFRFKTADKDKIDAYLNEHADELMKEYNASALAQEILTGLLDEGLIEYGGYDYKAKQKNAFSI